MWVWISLETTSNPDSTHSDFREMRNAWLKHCLQECVPWRWSPSNSSTRRLRCSEGKRVPCGKARVRVTRRKPLWGLFEVRPSPHPHSASPFPSRPSLSPQDLASSGFTWSRRLSLSHLHLQPFRLHLGLLTLESKPQRPPLLPASPPLSGYCQSFRVVLFSEFSGES